MDWWIVFFDNLWRDPAMSTAIQLATLLILIWTLYWIREYTMVARQQYQGSYRPMVVLEITQSGPSVQGLNITGVSFHNVGIGPALDVRMSDWQNGPYKIEWDAVPFIEKGHSSKAVFFVSKNGQSGGLARDYSQHGSSTAGKSE